MSRKPQKLPCQFNDFSDGFVLSIQPQLPQHLRASLDVGLSADELREAIMLTATIAGFPPAMNAMSTLKSVLAERDRDAASAGDPD